MIWSDCCIVIVSAMTDFYELQDIIWNDLVKGEDHLVPHPGKRNCDASLTGTQSHKRKHAEISVVSSTADAILPSNFCWNKLDRSVIAALKEKEVIMLENGLWTSSSDVASCDGDSNSGTFNASSDNIIYLKNRLRSSPLEPVGGELYTDDPILCDQGAAIEDSLYRYPLSQEISTDNDLNFFSSARQNNVNSDLSYYVWPEIQNFEDVDRMFGSCDPTYGLGIDNNDELTWFSSGQAIEVLNDGLKPTFSFQGSDADIPSSATECSAVTGENKSSPIANDLDKKLMASRIHSMELTANDHLIRTPSSLENVSEVISQIVKGKQIDMHGCRVKQHKSPEGITLEDKSCTSELQQECCHASIHLQPEQRSHDFPMTMPKVEKLGPVHKLGAGHPDHTDFMAQTACSGCVTFQKQVPYFENETEVFSEVNDNSTGIPPELDASNGLESCSINSLLDEVSLEAISFHQLQKVMEQLDLRTKICIRDSLYRLARSAEQRHKCGNTANVGNYDKHPSGLTSDGIKKCTGLMDMETDTNPIDRSIAHLLFHRPSNSSAVPVLDLSPKFKVHMSSTNSQRKVEEGAAEGNAAIVKQHESYLINIAQAQQHRGGSFY